MLNKIFNFFRKQPEKKSYNSEWDRRFETNPWQLNFVCPSCDTQINNDEHLWKKINTNPEHGKCFSYKCEKCSFVFKVEIGVIVMFKSFRYDLVASPKKKFRLINGEKR